MILLRLSATAPSQGGGGPGIAFAHEPCSAILAMSMKNIEKWDDRHQRRQGLA